MPRKTITSWKFIDRLLLPIIFFLSSFVAVLTFWQLLLGHRRAEIRAVTDEQASFVKSKLESELGARILPLEQLAAGWQRLRAGRGKQSPGETVMCGCPS